MTEPTQNWMSISKPQYECEKHGRTDVYMGISIYYPTDGVSIGNPNLKDHRMYCLECYIEFLDRSGVCQVKPK